MYSVRTFLLIILFLFTGWGLRAQTLKGSVRNGETGEPLPAVSVLNSRTQQYVFSERDGSFSITAQKGDAVSFSAIGYKTQQKIVPASLGLAEMHIDLFRLSYQLDEFVYKPMYTPYQLDSMERVSTYQRALARQRVRSVMSPVTLLADKVSKKSKQIYRFQKSFGYWEDIKFIESRYSQELVAQMTGLRGDTLAYFMNAHPMPYDYARVASELELKMWIRERYKVWRKDPVFPPLIGNNTIVPDTTDNKR